MAIWILQDRRSSALRDRQDCIGKSLGFRLKWDHLPAGATRCKTRFTSHPSPDEAEWARPRAHRPGPRQPMPNAARHSPASSLIRAGAARDGVHVAMRLQPERFDYGARPAPKAPRIVSTPSEVRPRSRRVQIPVAARGPFAVEPTNFPETDAVPRAGRDCGTCQECCVGFRSMKAATGQKRGLVPMAHE